MIALRNATKTAKNTLRKDLPEKIHAAIRDSHWKKSQTDFCKASEASV